MILCASPLEQYQSHRDEIVEAVRRVLERGHYILGPEVEAFEQEFAAYCGAGAGVGVNSGTDALILALRALGVGRGDEVVTVSQTALATAAAIIATGATPVLVDVDPVHYTMDPAGLAAAITARTKAIVPVHLYGQPADLEAILAVAAAHAIPIVEDCAQATGARYRGRRVGTFGLFGCFSFYPTKNLGAIGDGGMVVTNDAALAEQVRRIRQYGWNETRATTEPGLNSRLDELQAAILRVKLKTLDRDNRRRRAIAAEYGAALAETGAGLPRVRDGAEHVFHLYVVTCDRRDAVKATLAAAGVQAGIHYPAPVHLHCGYDRLSRLPASGLPVTEAMRGRILSLPMYPELTDVPVEVVRRALRQS